MARWAQALNHLLAFVGVQGLCNGELRRRSSEPR